jgi:hypothetical protein
MLERAVSCLNSSSRHLSRRSHCPVRQLHSSFWHHGAGDLDLPSWWSVIQPIAAVVARSEGDGKDVGMLDFLYPPKTLALMKKITIHSVEGVVRTRKEMSRARSFSSRSGLHRDIDFVTAVMNATGRSNIQQEYAPPDAESVEVSDHVLSSLMAEQPQPRYRVSDPMELLRQTLDGSLPAYSGSDDFEAAWQLYLQISPDDRSQHLLVSLLNYLSFSSRHIDEVRTMFLLGSNQLGQPGTATSYWSAIVSQLRRGSMEKAVVSHEHAIQASTSGYTGTNLLLAHLFHQRRWDLALQVYTTKMASIQEADKDWLRHDRTNVWDLVEKLPELTQTTNQFLFHVKNHADYKFPHVRHFIDQISLKAGLLGVANGNHRSVWRLMQALKTMGLDTPHLHQAIISSLTSHLSQSHPYRLGFVAKYQLLLDLYGRYRSLPNVQPPIELLNGVAKVIIESEMPHSKRQSDVSNVLWDYELLLGIKPLPIPVQHLVMRMHAKRGEVEKVHEMFDAMRAGGNVTTEAAHALLLVHARDGGPREVLHQINRLRHSNGWVPDETCWAIVLEEYAREDNLERCFQAFNNVLKLHSESLSSQTFFPLLNLCAARGSSRTIIELLELAKSNKVSIDMAMFSTLIVAHCNNKDLTAAEEAAESLTQAWKLGQLEGSITDVWNIILAALAQQRDLASTNRVLQHIQEQGISVDSMTYLSIMTALCEDNQHDTAWSLLTKTLPQKDLLVLPAHYAAVMKGFRSKSSKRCAQLDKSIHAYEHMLQAGIEPDASTKLEYLRAKILQQGSSHWDPESDEYSRVETEVNGLLDELAQSRQTIPSFEGRTFDSTAYDVAMQSLILQHAQAGKFNVAHKWVRVYRDHRVRDIMALQKKKKKQPKKDFWPMSMMTTLLSLHCAEGNHASARKLWKAILAQAQSFATATSFGGLAGFAERHEDMTSLQEEGTTAPGKKQVESLSTQEPATMKPEPSDVVVKSITTTSDAIVAVTEDTASSPTKNSIASEISSEEMSQATTNRGFEVDTWDMSPVATAFGHLVAPNQDSAKLKITIKPEAILPLSKPNTPRLWPSMRGVLNPPLVAYMRSIIGQRGDEAKSKIHDIVMDLVAKGWTPDNKVWNVLIRGLVDREFIEKRVKHDADKKHSTTRIAPFKALDSEALEKPRPVEERPQEEGREDALSSMEKTFAADSTQTTTSRRRTLTEQAEIARIKTSIPSISDIELHQDLEPKATTKDPSPSHILSAFRLTETLLMDNFPGWVAEPGPIDDAMKLGEWRGGFYWMDTKLWHGKREKGGEWLCPQLETLLDLRDCLRSLSPAAKEALPPLLDPAHVEILTTGVIPPDLSQEIPSSVLLEALNLHAPRTLLAIKSMPLVRYPPRWEPDFLAVRVGVERKELKGSAWVLDQNGLVQGRRPRREEEFGARSRDR